MIIDPIAIYNGDIVIYWSGLIICLGIIAGFFISMAIYAASNRNTSAMWVFLPFAILFSVFISRILHWYCHQEQYTSWYSALSDFTNGSYILQGTLLGVFLGAVCSKGLGMTKSVGKLLDAIAPGFALTIAFIRLSSLFNNSCRSKYTVETKLFQTLPFAVYSQDSVGNTVYKFAAFFIEFILVFVLSLILIDVYYKLHNSQMKAPCKRDGHIFRLFLILFSAIEIIISSTRNDPSFFHLPGPLKVLNKFLGFVSAGQLISAFIILFVMIYYSKRSALANGRRLMHTVLWICFLIGTVIVGAMEYCVQRWTNMYKGIYVFMIFGVITMTVSVIIMYRSCIKNIYIVDEE